MDNYLSITNPLPENVNLFNYSLPLIGYVSRTNTPGPEFDMVKQYVLYLINKYKKLKKKSIAVFIEPQIDTGYPDIVIVEYFSLPNLQWEKARNKLTISDLKILGYSNHQGLVYALANIDGIASGTYMNTRSFNPSKFKSPKDDDVKHKSTWYYLPSAFCEYKAALLDVAMQRGYLKKFYPQGDFNNPYSEMLFKGAQPSSTNYNEPNSFRHYLHCLKIQCEMLSLETYEETYDTYEFMLNNAENQIKDFKHHGMSGQNRDFAPAIEANRVAMCANDEDYGLKLRIDWKRTS